MRRRRRVAEFAAETRQRSGGGHPARVPAGARAALSLARRSSPTTRTSGPTEEEIREILAHTNKFFTEDELNCGACGYSTCRAKATAVYEGMAEEAMCLPFIIDQSERVCNELNVPWSNLRDVHRHLINSEKLASMGQMAAGVAHELNNPLSTILLYSHVLQRKLQDRDDLDHDLKLMARGVGALQEDHRQPARLRPAEPGTYRVVSVEELVASAVDGAACNLPPAPDQEVEIVVDVDPGPVRPTSTATR